MVAARQGFEAQLADLRARDKTIRERLKTLPTPAAIAEANETLNTKRGERTQLADLVEEARTAWVRDAQDVKTKLENHRVQFNEFKEQLDQINKLGPNGKCPTCTRPLGKEFEKVKGLLERQLEAVTDNGKYYRQRDKQLSKPPAELVKAEKGLELLDREIQKQTEGLSKLRTMSTEEPGLKKELDGLLERIKVVEAQLAASAAPYDRKRHQEVRQLLTQLEDIKFQVERLKVLADRAESLVQEAELAEQTLSERERHAKAVREQMESLGYREYDYTTLLGEVELAGQTLRAADLNLIRIRAEIASAEEALLQVARRREERKRREQEAREITTGLKLHAEVDRAFTDLRTELNDGLRPQLSESASIFLRDMTAGRYTELELDEDYSAKVIQDGEERTVISGGEEDMVNLALRLAISQMIADRAGQPLSLLVLDEVFGSLDEERRLSVVDLLRGLADRFPQVLLITHVESVPMLDRMIRVEVDLNRGTSFVREVGGPGGLAA